MISATRSNKLRLQSLVLLTNLAKSSVRRATSVATQTNAAPLPPSVLLPSFTKSLADGQPFMIPYMNNNSLFFDSTKDEKPATKDKPSSKEKLKRKEKDKDKDKGKEIEKDKDQGKKDEKDIEDPVKDIDTKPTADPNNPVLSSSSSKVLSGNGGDNNNDGDDKGPDGKKRPAPLQNKLHPPFLAIPMKDRPPLPGVVSSITVTDLEVIDCLEQLMAKEIPYFVCFHVRDRDHKDAAIDVIPNKEFVHDVGTLCQIMEFKKGKEEAIILLYPHCRVQMVELSTPTVKNQNIESDEGKYATSYLKSFGVSYAVTKELKDEEYDKNDEEIKVLVGKIKELCTNFGPDTVNQQTLKEKLSDPSVLADFICARVSANPKQIQEVNEILNVKDRLRQAVVFLQGEVEANKLRQAALKSMRERHDKNYAQGLIKEYSKELLKVAGVGENSKANKFDERVKHLKMTDEALEAYKTEKAKLGTQSDMEQNVVERYLDHLTSIPFGVYSKDTFNVKHAREILDRDHYGLEDVKDRILEFIAVGKISGNVNGKILCLAGPPGTGKTSIAKSIAESLNRKYTRIAVGGVQDIHDIKGHRRTYVASLPGRIITSLTQAKTSNPLMLIDEIDKLDTTSHGGAARAFLEILDPEQNHSFVDNFIEVSVDLSKVLFVCTANYLGSIPAPLRDRMEIIEVNGYTKLDKIEITKKYLIPAAAKKVGLEDGHVVIPDETISRLIDKYCRESGLRNVKVLVNRIFSKASRRMVEQLEENNVETEEPKEIAATESKVEEEPKETAVVEPKVEDSEGKVSEDKLEVEEAEEESKKFVLPPDLKIVVTPETLKDFVGPELYVKDRLYDTLSPGVATGLAFLTSGNGDALYIESILTDSISSDLGSAGIHVTGSLKEVMKESATIAYSFVKNFMVKNFPDNKFFEVAHVHVHCPGGAIPKDGPSAGIAFTSSLLSLALNKSLPNDTAMTGEITLTGRVLPIGGLREKSLGAKRAGYTKIIFPKDCEYQLDEIPDEVKEGLTYIPVEWYSEVYDHLFKDFSKEEGNKVWEDEFAKLEEKKKSKKQN